MWEDEADNIDMDDIKRWLELRRGKSWLQVDKNGIISINPLCLSGSVTVYCGKTDQTDQKTDS